MESAIAQPPAGDLDAPKSPGRTRRGSSSHSGDVFDPGGRAAATRILEGYSRDLEVQAGNVARVAGATRASAKHVMMAADQLLLSRMRSAAAADVGLALGALLLGAAISYAVNLLTGGTARQGSEWWAIGLGAMGLCLFAITATMKLSRR